MTPVVKLSQDFDNIFIPKCPYCFDPMVAMLITVPDLDWLHGWTCTCVHTKKMENTGEFIDEGSDLKWPDGEEFDYTP